MIYTIWSCLFIFHTSRKTCQVLFTMKWCNTLWRGIHISVTSTGLVMNFKFMFQVHVSSSVLRQTPAPRKAKMSASANVSTTCAVVIFRWLWRCVPHTLLKRQSLSTTTVLFRATFTRTIKIILINWLLVFDRSMGQNIRLKFCNKIQWSNINLHAAFCEKRSFSINFWYKEAACGINAWKR